MYFGLMLVVQLVSIVLFSFIILFISFRLVLLCQDIIIGRFGGGGLRCSRVSLLCFSFWLISVGGKVLMLKLLCSRWVIVVIEFMQFRCGVVMLLVCSRLSMFWCGCECLEKVIICFCVRFVSEVQLWWQIELVEMIQCSGQLFSLRFSIDLWCSELVWKIRFRQFFCNCLERLCVVFVISLIFIVGKVFVILVINGFSQVWMIVFMVLI